MPKSFRTNRFFDICLIVTLLSGCGGGGGGGGGTSSTQPDPNPGPPPLACANEEIPATSSWRPLSGFPVCYDSGAGFFSVGPQNGVKIGNVDVTPNLEILIAGTATPGVNSISIFDTSGRAVPGWPPAGFPTATLAFVLARMTDVTAGYTIFGGSNTVEQDQKAAATVEGGLLSGWPQPVANYVDLYPAAFDADGDGFDEVFIDEENGDVNAYRANGDPLPGFPVDARDICNSNGNLSGGQQVGAFAFGDIDGDTDTEVLAVSRSPNGQDYSCLLALNMDGSLVTGYPIGLADTRRDPMFTLGDVDGDGATEIVYVYDRPDSPEVFILSGNGSEERRVTLAGQLLYSTPASTLADLDGDGLPEIIVLAEGVLNVIKGDGTPLTGFPVEFSDVTSGGTVPLLSECGVVVGDIDGDQSPDLVFCARSNGVVELWAFDSSGQALPDTPLQLSTNGSNPRGPAIADIDGDGQNEVVIANYETLWALRYGTVSPSGPILWGQWAGNAQHTASYPE